MKLKLSIRITNKLRPHHTHYDKPKQSHMKYTISFKTDVRPLLNLAAPLALNGLILSAPWFFETLFLAHLGPTILAAGSLVSWLYGTLNVILFGTLSAINILVAHEHGAKNQENIALIARDGLVLAVMLAMVAFMLLWNGAQILLLFGQPPSIVALASSYLHPLAWSVVANFLFIACLEVLVGVGYTQIVLLFSIITTLLIVICSYVLIFGKWGFPALGIAGAGWGMAISDWITIIALFAYISCFKKYRIYFRKIFHISRLSYLIELLRIGFPIGFMYCAEVAFFFVLALMMGVLGSEMQAANQIALQYLGIFISMIFSIAQAVTVRMGHLIGANERRAAEKAGYVGIVIAALMMSMVAVIYWVSPRLLISVDIDIYNPVNFSLLSQIESLLAISAIFQIFEAIRISFFGALRALKDTRFTMFVSILSFWCIALPAGYIFAIPLHIGATGFWYGMVLGAAVSVFLLQWRFQWKIASDAGVDR